jgi:SNF2-related domain
MGSCSHVRRLLLTPAHPARPQVWRSNRTKLYAIIGGEAAPAPVPVPVGSLPALGAGSVEESIPVEDDGKLEEEEEEDVVVPPPEPWFDCICGDPAQSLAPYFDVACVDCGCICHADCCLEDQSAGADAWTSGALQFRCPKCEDPATGSSCDTCGRVFNDPGLVDTHDCKASQESSAHSSAPQGSVIVIGDAGDDDGDFGDDDGEIETLDLTRGRSTGPAGAVKSEGGASASSASSSAASSPGDDPEAPDEAARAGIRAMRQAGLRHKNEGWVRYTAPERMFAHGVALKEHQAVGISWLLHREEQRAGVRGGLLLDEAGLGKTLTMLTMCKASRAAGKCLDATLIICPPSLLWTWTDQTKVFFLYVSLLFVVFFLTFFFV